MKIGIDAFPLTGRIAGIGRYVVEICRQLDLLMPDAEFYLYSPLPLTIDLPSKRWVARIKGDRLARIATSYFWLKVYARRMIEDDETQVFWSTRTILPAFSAKFSTVATVHDLNYWIVPHSMSRGTRLAHQLWFANDLKRADAIVANSIGTANRLNNILGVKADTIARPGITPGFEPLPLDRVKIRLDELGIRQPYLLAVGTLEPRKNLPALIKAFISLKHEGLLAELGLYIAGNRGWGEKGLDALLKEAQATGVNWLGFVSDENLSALYSGASAFIFPSLYEGFGIPALESRACGTRFLGSDIPEIREAGGPDGVYVSPSVDGLRTGILKILKTSIPQPCKIEGWLKPAEVMAEQFKKLQKNNSTTFSS
jgi:glycosyltransferase involved in cell wall biosynthesis